MKERISNAPFIGLMRELELSEDELLKLIDETFKKEYGDENLQKIKANLEKAEIVDGVYYADIISRDYIWYVTKIVEKAEIDNGGNLNCLLRMDEPEIQYHYKGIRAMVTRLFHTCGGSMSLMRDVWDSNKGGEPTKSPIVVVKEASAPEQPPRGSFHARNDG